MARPSAHGQAMIRTATAAAKANEAPAPAPSQKASVADGERDHDRDEDAGDTVGEPLHRRLARLRLGDEPADLRERGVGADADVARTTSRPPTLIVAPTTASPGRTSTGTRLAGQERLVDRGAALLDDAVGRDLLARPDDEAVADARARRPGCAAPRRPRRARLTSLAPSSSSAWSAAPGASLRPRLEVATGEDEGHDDGRDLEVDLAGASRRGRRRGRRPSASAARRRRGRRARRPTSPRRRACRPRSACPSSPRRGSGSARRRGGTASRPRGRRASPAAARATASSRTAAARSSRAAARAARARPRRSAAAGAAGPWSARRRRLVGVRLRAASRR